MYFLLDSSENLPPTVRYNRKACRRPSHCPVHSYTTVQNLQSPIHWYIERENLRHIHIFKSSIVEPFHLYKTCNCSFYPRRPIVGYPIEFIMYCTSLNFFLGGSIFDKPNIKNEFKFIIFLPNMIMTCQWPGSSEYSCFSPSEPQIKLKYRYISGVNLYL